MLQRALDSADGLGGDLAIERGVVELLVAEQHLDDADVDLLFQEMGGEALPLRHVLPSDDWVDRTQLPPRTDGRPTQKRRGFAMPPWAILPWVCTCARYPDLVPRSIVATPCSPGFCPGARLELKPLIRDLWTSL